MFILLGLSAPSRPSTLLPTRRRDLVAPARGASKWWSLLQHPEDGRTPSKTALCDEGCLLDSPYVQTLETAFKALSQKTITATLSDFSFQQVATVLSRACETLRTGHLTLYQLCHAGVSVDIAKGWRQLNEVERRGSKAQSNSMHGCVHTSRRSTDYARFSGSQRTCSRTAKHT